jgi:16S rRNA processing protein RimM
MHTKKSAQQPPEYLVVGRVVRPHGIRGGLIVEPLSSMIRSIEPGTHILLGEPPEQTKILQLRPHRNRFLLTLAGCASREQAERFRGMELRLPFDEVAPLPEGEYYFWQILGLSVIATDGRELGEVVDILETGANDVYIVRDQDGQEKLIPAIAQVIKQVDLVEGIIQIELLPGLLDA